MGDPKYQNIGSIEIRVIEECSELIQACCKAKRFGFQNSHPNNLHIKNYEDILFEIADVRRVCDELEQFIKVRYEE